jgi:dsRNA-specific ribonuclease
VLQVWVDKQMWGHGRGRSKQLAAQAAANQAMKLVTIIEHGILAPAIPREPV